MSLGQKTAQAQVSTVSTFTTSGVATTGGSDACGLISVQWYGGAALAASSPVTDNKGNTWTQIQSSVQYATDTNFRAALFKCERFTGGTGHTFTVTWASSVSVEAVAFIEWLGCITAGTIVDQAPVGNSDAHSTATPYVSTTTSATTQATEVAIAFTSIYSTGATAYAYTWNNSYTNAGIDLTDPATWTSTAGYKVLSATGTQQSSVTSTNTADDAITFIATLKLQSASLVSFVGDSTTQQAKKYPRASERLGAESPPPIVNLPALAANDEVSFSAGTPWQADPAFVPPALAAQALAKTAEASNPVPERYPPARTFGAEAMPAVQYRPRVEANPALFGWRPPPNRERGAEVPAPIAYDPEVEAYPALYGWRPGPNREPGAIPTPPFIFTAVAEANQALHGWQPGPNRERGAEVAPPPVAQAPLPVADPALTGWRVPLNRATGAETQPPLAAAQPLPNVDRPLRGWQPPPNRDPGFAPVPPVVYPPPTESKQADFGWRRVGNRDRGVDGLPPTLSLPQFADVPDVWSYTRAMPALQVRQGVEPLASVKATGPVGDTSPSQQRHPRALFAGGSEAAPGLAATALTSFAEASTTTIRGNGRTWWAGAESPPPFVSIAIQNPDSAQSRVRRTQRVELTQALAPLLPSIVAWGFEPGTPSNAPRFIRQTAGVECFPVVTIYQLLPWIWEDFPQTKRRPRRHDNEVIADVSWPLLLASNAATGPIYILSFTNQLPVVTVVGFADQLATIQVLSFDSSTADFRYFDDYFDDYFE